MPKYQQRDFYFGAALSLLFRYNNDSRPSLIESIDNTTQVMRMQTDTSKEFYVYMKYTTSCKYTKKENLNSWSFQISEKDKTAIKEIKDSGFPLYLFFICGMDEEMKTGEIAIITGSEYDKISHKNSLTINTLGLKPRNFDIHYGKAHMDTFPVERNRIENKLTDLK